MSSIPKTYISWGQGMAAVTQIGGWFFGEVQGSYAKTKQHYFEAGKTGPVCDSWYVTSGISVWGPVHSGNFRSVPWQAPVCGLCRQKVKKLRINLPESFYVGGSASNGPLKLTVTQEIEISPRKIATFVQGCIEDYITDFMDDEGIRENDDGAVEHAIVDWVVQRLS